MVMLLLKKQLEGVLEMSKTIVALDFSSKQEVIDFLKQFDEPVYVKIGMELTYALSLIHI